MVADSLYEAVAMAVARFRRDDGGWFMCPPGPGCEFQVKVTPDSPVTHTVSLKKLEIFALHGVAAGPKGILRKDRIRKLLGLHAHQLHADSEQCRERRMWLRGYCRS